MPLVVSVRAAGATAATQPFLTQTFNLVENSASVAVLLGDPAQTGAAVGRFQLLATPAARVAAATPGRAEFSVFNGSPDAPPLDVKLRAISTVADDVGYTALAPGYTSVLPGRYTFDVTQADGVTRVGSYAADLTGATDKALTLLASGFAAAPPAGTPEANRFGLLAVASDGTSVLLPAVAAPVAASLTSTFTAAGPTGVAQFDPAGKSQLAAAPTGVGAGGRTATADVTGDGVADVLVGTGPGVPTAVRVFDGATKAEIEGINLPFEATFTGGVFVAAGDLNGDAQPDIIVTPDEGGGPVVAVYQSLQSIPAAARAAMFLPTLYPQLARFLGIEDPNFRGGARAAVGDLNADGRPDLLVAAGFGGGPRLAAFNGATVVTPTAAGQLPPKLLPDFFVFEPTLRNGVYVAAGDVSGDGAADVIVGGGPGGGPRVMALSGRDLTAAGNRQTQVANFFAGDPNNRDGVRVAAKDLDGDPQADVLVGLGSAGSPQVRGFRGKDLPATVGGTTPPAAAVELNPFTAPGTVYVG